MHTLPICTPHARSSNRQFLPLLGAALAVATLALSGCATRPTAASGQPVLYPNAAYQKIGPAAAQQQVQACAALAAQQGVQPTTNASQAAAAQAGKTAAIAGVAGSVGSALFGRGKLEDALKHGAQHAVLGAAVGGTQGALSQRPNPIYQNFVGRCLAEKGLEVIGW